MFDEIESRERNVFLISFELTNFAWKPNRYIAVTNTRSKRIIFFSVETDTIIIKLFDEGKILKTSIAPAATTRTPPHIHMRTEYIYKMMKCFLSVSHRIHGSITPIEWRKSKRKVVKNRHLSIIQHAYLKFFRTHSNQFIFCRSAKIDMCLREW